MDLDAERLMDLLPLGEGEFITDCGISQGIWKGLEGTGSQKKGIYHDADGDGYFKCGVMVQTNRGVYLPVLMAYIGQVGDAYIHLEHGDESRSVESIVDRKKTKLEAAMLAGANFVPIEKYDDGTLIQMPPCGYTFLEDAVNLGEQELDKLRGEYERQSRIAGSCGFLTRGIVTPENELYLMLR